MLLMIVPLWNPSAETGVGSGRAIAHTGDATPGETCPTGEIASVFSSGATSGSGLGPIRRPQRRGGQAALVGSRSSRRRILPTLVFGSSVRNSTYFGCL